MEEKKEFLTTHEVCAITGFSISAIYKFVRIGALPCYRPSGRKLVFKRADVLAWMSNPSKRRIYE